MFLKYNWPGIVWAIIILVLLSIPGSDLPKPILGIKYIDKIGHFGIFFILILLVIFGFYKQYFFAKLRSFYIRYAIVCSCSWAILTEIVQLTLTADRSFEYADIVADFIGIIIGTIVFLRFKDKILTLKLSKV